MRLIKRLQGWLDVKTDPSQRTYSLNEESLLSLNTLASQEQRITNEVTSHLIVVAKHDHKSTERFYKLWDNLSLREQEVTALICVGRTSRQIASQLNISPSTVKTHVHNLLVKFCLNDRQELRLALVDFDFKLWVSDHWK
ncbi:MAG: response regulator transcription factor [Anaerolineaceae bacterium]|nr:response regulator transcription factor [Anaerolineaceae bacterium]